MQTYGYYLKFLRIMFRRRNLVSRCFANIATRGCSLGDIDDIPILLMRLIVIRYNGRGIMVFVKQVVNQREKNRVSDNHSRSSHSSIRLILQN